MPAGRKLQVGFYYGDYFGGATTPQIGTAKYDFDLTMKALQMPELGGVTAYPLEVNPASVMTGCLAPGADQAKFDVLRKVYPLFP